MNYFELFSLPAQFSLDMSELTLRYRELQRQCHPDRVASADHAEQAEAMRYSSMVNDGYETLKHPLLRAAYMLELQGVMVRSEQRTFQDPMFLMQQIELRETLEAISDAKDEDALAQFETELMAQIDGFVMALASQLDQYPVADPDVIADDVRRLKFFYNLLDEVERLEDALLD